MVSWAAMIKLLLLFLMGPVIGYSYFYMNTLSITMKGIIFFSAFMLSVFIPADADFTLLFYEKFGKSTSECLKGKVIWITGASSGLGAALAIVTARNGAKVILSARSVEKLSNIKQKCIENGSREEDVFVLPLDMVDYKQHQPAFDQVIKYFGKLDILVSNAGRSQRANWEKIDIAVDKEIFELNVFSLLSLCRIVTIYFLNNGGGHHVVTSSTAGKLAPPMSASYTATKHALHGYFDTLRLEKSGDNISVTMLCPGPFDSNLMEACFTDQLDKKVSQERTGNRMSGERCAELSCVAICNKLSEVWIAQQPVLIFYYAMQYFPGCVRGLMSLIGLKTFMKLRDGHSDSITPAS